MLATDAAAGWACDEAINRSPLRGATDWTTFKVVVVVALSYVASSADDLFQQLLDQSLP